MSAPSLFRIIVHVSNPEKSAAFYATLFGLPARPVGGGRIYFDAGPVIFALLDATQRGGKVVPLGEYAYFAVDDLEAVHARAKGLGCLSTGEVHDEPAGEIVVRPWQERSFYAYDPDGNGLCFVDATTKFTGMR